MEPPDEEQTLLNGYTFCTMTEAPDWYVCPLYRTVFEKDYAFTKICNEHPITLAPSLSEVLKQPEPPTLGLCLNLPSPPTNIASAFWGIYVLVLEKPGFPP